MVISRLFTIMRIKEQPSRKSSVVQTISLSLYDRDNANEQLSRKSLACSGLNKRQCHTSYVYLLNMSLKKKLQAINNNYTEKTIFTKILKNVDTNLKIIILLDQNDYVGNSSIMNNTAKHFDNLATPVETQLKSV